MPYGLSFSPDFFRREADAPASSRPTSIEQAVMSLSGETWAALAENVFSVDPSQLDVATVLRTIQETNTCGNLDSPVEVYIDPAGDFTVLVYDSAEPGA